MFSYPENQQYYEVDRGWADMHRSLQYDSDKIIPYLEDKYPEPPLGKPADLPQM